MSKVKALADAIKKLGSADDKAVREHGALTNEIHSLERQIEEAERQGRRDGDVAAVESSRQRHVDACDRFKETVAGMEDAWSKIDALLCESEEIRVSLVRALQAGRHADDCPEVLRGLHVPPSLMEEDFRSEGFLYLKKQINAGKYIGIKDRYELDRWLYGRGLRIDQ